MWWLYLMLLSVWVAPCSANIQVNTRPLLVQYGRSVSVEPQANLAITYPKGSQCRVTVLRDNPLSERNGFLMPNQFSCDFKLGDVSYTHLGSKFHTRDFVRFQVRVDTPTEMLITPVILHVSVLFTPMEIVKRNYPVTVPELGGISTGISGDILEFAYDPATQYCHVVHLHFSAPLPRYGILINITNERRMNVRYECQDFLNSDIRYAHRKIQSPNRDYIPLMVEISDKDFNVLRREYFQIFIRILGARVNEAPMVSFQASNDLEVADGALSAVTPDVLEAFDLETPKDEIIFNVTQALRPGEGQLVTLDDPYRAVSAFYQRDVKDLKIAYRPPILLSSSPSRMFQMILTAIDSEGASSRPILLLIMVNPSSINAPVVVKNKGLSLFEGQSRAITSVHNLKVTDRDNFDLVNIQVIGGLRHGQLRILGNPITLFMATDIELNEPVVSYQHDNSETYSDTIIFRASDGNNTVDFVFPINIAPLDDQAPVLVYNTGMEVNEGGIAKVDQYMLSAMDVDSDITKIRFKIITQSNRSEPVGVFFLRQTVRPPRNMQSWRMHIDGYFEKNTTEFTQRDLMEGKVYYRHLGGESFNHRVEFVLLDDAPQPNMSPIQTFEIVITSVDDQAPTLFPGCLLVISLDEYGRRAFTKSDLHYTDADSPDDKLIYRIISPLRFVDGTNASFPAGEIVLQDTGLPVTHFTQLQVNHGKVVIKAPYMEMGLIPRHAQFMFSVSDTSGNSLEKQGFQVFYRPINNKAPRVDIYPVAVGELDEVTIDPNVISITDEDTPDIQVKLSITHLPRYGFLAWDGIQMTRGDWFTMNDVADSRLSYRHIQSGEASDEIGLMINDGVHKVGARMEILISKKPPNVTLTVLNVTLRVKEHSKEAIKLPPILTTTSSPRDMDMGLFVDTRPRVGQLLLNGVRSEVFNIRDIQAGMVSYEHTGMETGLQGDVDRFNLTFANQSGMVMEGKRYKAIEVKTLILPVDSLPPLVTVLRPLTVQESDKCPLTQDYLTITDRDTREHDVTCLIDMQPTYGYLENVISSPGSEISNTGKRITSFNIRDIKQGNINYVQSVHAGVEPRMDWVAVTCSDGNNTSPRRLISVIILPKNDELPQLFTREFVVQEGGDLTFEVTILNAIDADSPLDELIFHVIDPPKYGVITDTRLDGNKPLSAFTLTQIQKSNSVVYQHDGSETTSDFFRIGVTDGIHNTTKEIRIRIIAVDDERPMLAVNVGLRLQSRGDSEVLTERNIRATDIDSPDENITFIIRTPPRDGTLQIMRHDGTFHRLSRLDIFKMIDITRRLVVYSHNPKMASERDEIRLDVTDGQNTLLNQMFYIFIKNDDRIPPTVISKGIRLKQGTRVTITSKFLSASDLESDNTKLRYTLTKVPTLGHLELVGTPRIHVRTFSQLDIAANRLIYVHTSKDEFVADSFDFEVTDGSSSTVTRKFLITLLDVNNKRPVVMAGNLNVKEGASVFITPFELRAQDRDTPPVNLHFTVARAPVHGVILKNGASTRVFSQQDVNNNLISYLHDGTDTTLDSFQLSVDDGKHKDFFFFPKIQSTQNSLEVRIFVSPVDNRPPRLAYSKGATDLQVLAKHKLGYKITKTVLRCEDPDSNNTKLFYQIIKAPINGILTKSLNQDNDIGNFTQGDLETSGIYYVLNSGSNTTSDEFEFTVQDPAGNQLAAQSFSLVWAWVTIEYGSYRVQETDGFLGIRIRREGFLGTSSFVRMLVFGVTAASQEDFSEPVSAHVQFSPGQTQAEWRLRIIDDDRREGEETLEVRLVKPRACVIGITNKASVTITDPEDVPSVEMVKPQQMVEEGVGRVGVQLRRTGDQSVPVQVMCVTQYKLQPGWARGTRSTSLHSYSDFITRSAGPSSVITINKGEARATCHVTIIDDTLYEPEERLLVQLTPYMGHHVINKYNTTEVIILPDAADEPKISLVSERFAVDESDGAVSIEVKRTGTDLSRSSSVFIRTRQTDPVSAEANKDYIPIAKLVYFAPHVTSRIVHVTILDDTGYPRVEEDEQFEVVLRTPINGRTIEPAEGVVTITDAASDLPVVQFEAPSVTVKETSNAVRIPLMRTGDLSFTTTIRCYTRQDTAAVQQDFTERPNTDDSIVTFAAKENRKDCVVAIKDDASYEGRERFRVVLARSSAHARIGKRNESAVIIDDLEDKPEVRLSKRRQYVGEPAVFGQSTTAILTVQRSGDLAHAFAVRVFTADGTAKSGRDYQPLNKILRFEGNSTTRTILVKILYNPSRKIRRAFIVRLAPESEDASFLGRKKTVVYIVKSLSSTAVTFPLPPRVVSLRHYDDVMKTNGEVAPGYPVICVTACDPKYPRYAETGSMCNSQAIDFSLTKYRWSLLLAGQTEYRDVTFTTFFTDTNALTLDSIYLVPGSKIKCSARAVTSRGETGVESSSPPVMVTKAKHGACPSRDPNHVGAEPFTASIAFTGPQDARKGNMVHIKVQVPHADGMIPIISTSRINVRQALTTGVMRTAQHKCSNVLLSKEIPTSIGFLNGETENSLTRSAAEPYQFDAGIRGNSTVEFYKNLNLESCVWVFESFYDISEVIKYCGGSLGTSEQTKELTQSQIALRVPLFVSYVYQSKSSHSDWLHYDHATFLRLTLEYDTAVLLKDGVQTPAGSVLGGSLWLTSIKIRDSDKRLVVNFKTKTKFTGMYVLKKEGASPVAMVISRDHPQLSFTLTLLSSQQTYENPEQRWQFVSDYAVRDYTGNYYIKLVPCLANPGISYTDPPNCHAKNTVTFNLPIRFQQIPDPVPARFTLAVTFHLMSDRRGWLSGNPSNATEDDLDSAFSKDSKIYGLISLDQGARPVGARGGYLLSTEQVHLCSGQGRYVPSYDPANNKYGCLADSIDLMHRLKVLDRETPESVSKRLGSEPFEAKFASDDPAARALNRRVDSDGFEINSAPLFQVPRGQKWYLHAVYSVSSDSPRRRRSSQLNEDKALRHYISEFFQGESTPFADESRDSHVSRYTSSRDRREASEVQDIGKNKGTNMRRIQLLYESSDDMGASNREPGSSASSAHAQTLVNPLVIGIAVVCAALLIALVVVWTLYKRKGSPQEQPVKADNVDVRLDQPVGTAV